MSGTHRRIQPLFALIATLAAASVVIADESKDSDVKKKATKVWTDVKEGAQKVGEEIADTAKEVGADVADTAQEVWYKGKKVARPLWEDLSKSVQEFWNKVVDEKDREIAKLRQENEELKRKLAAQGDQR